MGPSVLALNHLEHKHKLLNGEACWERHTAYENKLPELQLGAKKTTDSELLLAKSDWKSSQILSDHASSLLPGFDARNLQHGMMQVWS